MKMRKKLSVALVLAALLCLAGCGGQDNNTATSTGMPSDVSISYGDLSPNSYFSIYNHQ